MAAAGGQPPAVDGSVNLESLEFIRRSSVDATAVQFWIDEEWLLPASGITPQFSEADLARARLIRDLTLDFGVNNEGIAIILHLLDQIYGLRGILRIIHAEDGEPDPRGSRFHDHR